MKKTVHVGQAQRVRPNWRRSESFNTSEKHWLRKVGLWENRATLEEATWWGRVLSAVSSMASTDPDRFTAESLKRKFAETSPISSGASTPAAKAAGSR